MASEDKQRRRPGPAPEHLKLDGDWEERVGDALAKPRPEKGWPKPGEREDGGPKRDDTKS